MRASQRVSIVHDFMRRPPSGFTPLFFELGRPVRRARLCARLRSYTAACTPARLQGLGEQVARVLRRVDVLDLKLAREGAVCVFY